MTRTAALLPKATDPKLWLVKCRPGKERDSVAAVLRGLLELDRKGETIPLVFSAVSRDTLKGYIYVEAFKPADIMAAIKRLHLNHMVFASPFTKPSLVPMVEMTDVLAPGKTAMAAHQEAAAGGVVEPGAWVRVKRGKYAGDLAQVMEVPVDGAFDPATMVRIRLLPRLSYRTSASGSSTKANRPPPRPFDPHEAAQHGSVTKSRGLWVYGQELYTPEGGFLLKEVKLGSLQTASVVPRPDELARFGEEEESTEHHQQKKPSAAQEKSTPLSKGDRVVVIEGELKGLKGQVDSLGADRWVNVLLDHEELKRSAMPFRTEQLLRCFESGDTVRVASSGATAMVIEVSANWRSVVVLLTGSHQQLSLPASEIISAEATATTTTNSTVGVSSSSVGPSVEIELNDLVQTDDIDPVFGLVTRILPDEGQLVVVDQAGTERSLPLARIRRIDTRALNGGEAGPGAFRAGDRVQVDSAAGPATQPATVLQSYRTVAFLRALDTKEIIVRRFPAIHRLAMHPMAQAPASRERFSGGAGGRHLLGKSVTIAGGPYKGYAGIVKDVLDNQVRVELHTNSKVVTVERDRVILPQGTGSREDHDERERDFARGGKTPAWSTAKTPGWGAGGATGKTPAWNAGSGKTPAWNAGSGKTPAWNADTGKTPAWNAGASGKTPSWQPGGRTPSWNPQATGRTPAWQGGGKTPVWSQPSSAAAPSWNSAATPAWNSAAAAAGSSSSDIVAWAQPGVIVRPRSDTSAALKIDSVAPGRIILDNGQSYRPADLEPVPPAKKDRVRVVSGTALQPDESTTGTVIGLDGPDAVVRLDDTSVFRIVPLQHLARIQ